MRALICGDFGPPEGLSVGELPAPQPGKGEVLINVGAAGVSFADTLMIRDLHQNKHTLPFAAGMEVGGRITALGEGVAGSLALGAVLIGEEVEGRLQAEGLSVNVEFQPRHGFIEQLIPGRCADNRLIVKEFFQFVAQLVRFHRAQPVEDGFEAVQGLVGE